MFRNSEGKTWVLFIFASPIKYRPVTRFLSAACCCGAAPIGERAVPVPNEMVRYYRTKTKVVAKINVRPGRAVRPSIVGHRNPWNRLQLSGRVSRRRPWQHWYEDARVRFPLPSAFIIIFFSIVPCYLLCRIAYGAGRDRFGVIRERRRRGAFDHDLCRAEVVSSLPLSSHIDRQGLAAVIVSAATCPSYVWLIFSITSVRSRLLWFLFYFFRRTVLIIIIFLRFFAAWTTISISDRYKGKYVLYDGVRRHW